MKVSIIIPTYNDGKIIYGTLEDLYSRHSPDEIIVVDGGSTDQTVKIASEWTEVLSSPRGRAKQWNVGARHATGSIFLFLNADTKLPAHALLKIKEELGKGTEAGRFTMGFGDSRWYLKLYSLYTRFQCFSYGEEGFFVRRDMFDLLRGFREDVPFEDMDFYKRLRRFAKPVILKDPVIASAHRFLELRSMTKKWLHLLLVPLYYLGFNISRLQKKLLKETG